MGISAQIIADSVNPSGSRLTTFILEYPRFVHAELLTHRVFSKNAASSRAIPIEKMIEAVKTNPAMPVWWGKNQSGMQAKEELNDVKFPVEKALPTYPMIEYETVMMSDQDHAKEIWLQSRDIAIESVKKLNKLGLHKQIANRILEPWFHIRIILSGTEFENFFALRAHPDAQPEIQRLAYKMLDEYNKSKTKALKPGEWHIPFGDIMDIERLTDVLGNQNPQVKNDFTVPSNESYNEAMIKIAIARCARISYFNYEGKDDYEADIKLCDRLFGSVPRHLSPTEHVAVALDNNEFIANYRGFKQYRYFFDDQNLKDPRVL